MGLETEYAIRYRPAAGAGRPTDHQLFSLVAAALADRLPTAVAASDKIGLFLATGGAVWFERARFANQAGLVEGSTPECRGPRQLLICQRAQDRLLAEATHQAGSAGDFTLLKNCRDGRGQSYGAQENYEVVLARGWRLALWRAAWTVCYPFALAYMIAVILALLVLILALLLVNLVVATPVYFLVWAVTRADKTGRRRLRERLFGRFWVSWRDEDMPWPPWVEEILFPFLQVALSPVLLLISGVLSFTDQARTQRRLVPFLASRAVLGGSGWLDERGNFHVTEKAETRRTVALEIVPDASRPVFAVGHYLKLLLPRRGRWRELMAGRQRLQISLGDSNLCEEAEYLRIATTALVLDVIEAGALAPTPALRQPLRAIRRISRDPGLRTAVALRGGGAMTALQLQRWYLDACRRFVDAAAEPPPEAHDVLRRWADVLDRLETDRRSLVGRLDWVTKEYLLATAGAGLPWAARKKLDLRYHELSPAGYHRRLAAAGRAAALVSEQEVEQAMRVPPPSSPARHRARYIREFSGTNTVLKVGWRFLEVVTNGRTTQMIDLRLPGGDS
jgi:proteasome accessory factor A